MVNEQKLIEELLQRPIETEWIEFKHNNSDPEEIGQYISALSNSATYHDHQFAYMVWGIDDTAHEIIGTSFDYMTKKVGNEELENWLRKLLSENANFTFRKTNMNNLPVILLIIDKAIYKPVTFKNIAYIRIGSYKKSLKDHSSMESQLWAKIQKLDFEGLYAKQDLEINEVLQLLDYSAYFDMLKMPLPSNRDEILDFLLKEQLIDKQDNGLFAITNLGALLFARNLTMFSSLARKGTRVIQYKGNNKLELIREDIGTKGYAIGFQGLIKYIDDLLPVNEVIVEAIRERVSVYPEIAIREAVANALIHQELSTSGTGPLIEIFDSRLEITNPGRSLVNIDRIIDNPPKSRNEKLASLMRRLGVCEELGSGWDKIAYFCEFFQLPAPKIELYENNTKVTLYGHIKFSKMGHEDRLRACYQHACLKYVSGDSMSNSTLRQRFGLDSKGSASISRLIKEAVEMSLIKPVEPSTAPKHMKYVPIWA